MINGSMDLVSIIIPVYNVAPYLDRCMKSIWGQTYLNLEIILVDDGATDESGAMCDEYASKDSRIVVIHQENRGLSAARNAGTLASSGKYICFVDPDDEVDAQYVELLHEAMISQKVSLAMCSYVSVFEKDNIIVHGYPCEAAACSKESVFKITTKKYIQNYVERKMTCVTAWSRMYSSKLAHKILFPEGRVYEDLATHISFAVYAEEIAIVKQQLYIHYKQRINSITDTISEQNVKDNLWAYQTVYSQIIDFDVQLAEKAKWIIQEAPLSILILIYLGQRNDKIIDKAFIQNLRSTIRKYLYQGRYHNLYTWLKAVIVLTVPHMLPIIWKTKNIFQRKSKA